MSAPASKSDTKEEKVKKYIQRELELNKMNQFVSQILIPTEKVYQIKNGKKVNKERNFFPGYILLEAQLFAELIHLIRNKKKLLKLQRTIFDKFDLTNLKISKKIDFYRSDFYKKKFIKV